MNVVTPDSQVVSMKQVIALIPETVNTGPLSPLEKNASRPDTATLQELAETGLLNEDGHIARQWRTAAEILADPDIMVKVAVAGRKGTRQLTGYGCRLPADDFVGFTRISEDDYRCTWPLRKDHFSAILITGLGLDEEIPCLDISVSISTEALVALAGFTDALHATALNNMLARVDDIPIETDLDQVVNNATEGLFSRDCRWISSLLRHLLPGLPDPSDNVVRRGLTELAGLELLANRGHGSWTMTENGQKIVTHWQMVMAGGVLSSKNEEDRDEKFDRSMVVLRTLGSVWMLDCEPTGAPNGMIHIHSPSSADLIDRLEKRIVDFCSTHPSADDTGNVGFCRHCGAELLADARFCSKCGNSVSVPIEK